MKALVDTAFYDQVRGVIQDARRFVHATANVAMVKAYWLVGKMIVEKQGGAAKAAYGDGLIDSLSAKLTAEFGAGVTRVNLFSMRKFYLAFPKVQTLCEHLSWSHYRLIITVENEEAQDLERLLITHLQKFLLELGRGFSFVARQKRLTLDGELVFYNYLLKCFVLVDLKTDRLTHADKGGGRSRRQQHSWRGGRPAIRVWRVSSSTRRRQRRSRRITGNASSRERVRRMLRFPRKR